MEPPLNSGVYALYCRPQCGCSCLKSVAITVIWVAPTASQVWATITSLSFPHAVLFSPNLLLADWLAVKWRFLFSSWSPYRAWQQWRRTLLRNGVEIAFCFFLSHCKPSNLHPGVPYLPLDTGWEYWIYKTRSERDMERKIEEKGRHHICERRGGRRLGVCLTGKEREEKARLAAQSFVKLLNCLFSYVRWSLPLCIHICSYFLIYKISSIPTHFPRRTLGVFPWVWNDLNNVAQTVCRQQRIPGQRAKTPVTNHKSFVLWVVLFCGVNLRVHYRRQGTRKISLPLTARGTDPGFVSWGCRVTLHLQQLWLFPAILLLFVKPFILISAMSLWWIGPVHSHTIRHFTGQL